MQLYNLALSPTSSIIKTVSGSFTSGKTQQIVIARSKSIELYAINELGKLELIAIDELFCIIRTIVAFRYHGTAKDLLIIGSDSGKLIILEFDQDKGRFSKTHEETFGKSGCRRIVPGQYIAVDPKGRAIMIAAIEKQKFVYVLERHEDKLSIFSPREAHKSFTICVDLVALDVGSENAMFVCIEMSYGEIDDKEALINTGGVKKSIVYYEMDFGMNTVIRKRQQPVDPTAHMLIAVPGFPEGPGGVIVVLEDYLLYRQGQEDQLVRFPLRKNRPLNRKTQFTAHSLTKVKEGFFFLIASQLGDIFKIEFLTSTIKNRKEVTSIKIEYFDTVSCLTSMCLTRNGYIFCASEKEDHCLCIILDKENEKPVYTRSQMPSNSLVEFEIKDEKDRPLQILDTLEQYGPLTDLKVADLKDEGNPQVYALNASGAGKSYLRVIKQGLRIKTLNAIKYYEPKDIWCLKTSREDEEDTMIVLSFIKTHKTLVLRRTPNGYSQAKDTGLVEDCPTIHVGKLDDDSLIQIIQSGFRHLQRDNIAKSMKFEGKIIKGIVMGKQMALALAGGDILYYELDTLTGLMSEVSQTTLDTGEVVAFDFSPLEKGRVRSNFLAAAFTDNTVRIFELNPESCLKLLSSQNMKEQIESIAVQELDTSESETQRYGVQLCLYAGLNNGLVIRTSVDTITGKLSDSRPKYLGSKPVKCIKLTVQGKPAILALSSRPWLIYTHGKKHMTTLLASPYISTAAKITTGTNLKHTIMAYSENFLKVITLETFGNIFHSEKVALEFSAKKMQIFRNHIAIVESEQIQQQKTDNKLKKWHGHVSIYSPKENKITSNLQFDQNEICLSLCFLSTEENGIQSGYLVLGCVKNLCYSPQLELESPSIKVYAWDQGTFTLTFLHSTDVEAAPLVLHSWKDKILAGIGPCLRAYEVGKKKLLRKAEIKHLNSAVNTIKTWGERIFATEVNDSFHMYKFKPREQTFYDIADDVLNRYITATAILDYHTVIGADKFQNIFISRVPQNAEEDFENNPNTYRFRWENGYLNGAPFKMEQICSFYVGQVVTSVQKTRLLTSGDELIIYSTINGAIGALCPFETKQDVDFFTHLEMYMRNLTPTLGGREYLSYRSYYTPCKAIVDGDICEVYNRLPYEEQVEIGKHLDRAPQEIQRKLEEMRNRLI